MTAHLLDQPRCALWATMGVGKTVTTGTALDTLFLAGESHPALVLGPLRVARDVWPTDLAKWNHLRNIEVSAIIGSREQRIRALQRDVSVYTTNYEQLPWLIEHLGDRWPFRTVVADESTKLKGLRISERTSTTGKKFIAGQGAARAKALGMIAHTPLVTRFWELTGTPAPNGLQDLWGQAWYLDMGQRLGRTYTGFSQRYFRTGYDGYGLEPLPHAEAEIHEKLRDICLTVDLADYIDIAEPVFHPVYVRLPPKARNAYREMERKFYVELECGGKVDAVNAAAKSQKLFQLASGAVYLTPDVEGDDDPRSKSYAVVHDAKLEALASVLEEAAGMPVLCGIRFRSDRERIMREWPRAVDISTEAGMAAFKAGKSPIGIAHPKSMGHGIDGLQDVTNIACYFSHDWNLEEYLQLLGRIGPVRQMQSGHNREVHVYQIVAEDTVDEDAIERRTSKKTVMQALMDRMKRRT